MFIRKILLTLLIVSTGVQADTETRTSTWFMSLSRFQFAENYRAFVDLQPRFTVNDISGGNDGSFDTLLMRGAVGYQITPNIGLYQGYGLIPTYDPKRVEHRSFQELLASQSLSKGKLVHRVRFEQRFVEGVDDTPLRVRYFGRFTYPLKNIHDRLSLAINEEVFIHVNDSDGGPQSGFNQNRLFLGLNYRVSKTLAFDTGYQNQYINGQGGASDVMNHILFFGVLTNF